MAAMEAGSEECMFLAPTSGSKSSTETRSTATKSQQLSLGDILQPAEGEDGIKSVVMVKDVSPTCKDDHHAAHAMQATSRENNVLLSTNQCSEVMASLSS